MVAKQVKVERKKESSKTAQPQRDILNTRSPKTNLIFAAALGLIYLTLFNQSPQQSLLYAVGAFLFFNTVDYCILYYRIKKNLKENK